MTVAVLPDLDHETFLRRSIGLAVRSREAGNHPFAALLVSPEGDVLMEQMNDFVAAGDSTGHAERFLMTRAPTTYPPEYLRGMGFGITHTPFSLSIPNILCQTFRMRRLTATICLILSNKGKSYEESNRHTLPDDYSASWKCGGELEC